MSNRRMLLWSVILLLVMCLLVKLQATPVLGLDGA